MNFMSLNVQGLAQKAKTDWVKELCFNNKVNLLSLQEMKMEQIKDKKDKALNHKKGLKKVLAKIDSSLDKGDVTSATLEERMNIMKKLTDLENIESLELAQKAKSVLEYDVVVAANHFFTHGFCRKGGNSSFIVLIQKTQDAQLVKDFRPLSQIGSLYKIIAKILVNHLVIVMGDLVNEVQYTFIANRQILDGPFILNELIQWCKAKKKQTMIFKVDFEKAFDSVCWDFLDDVLKNFGFGVCWCDWIRSCLRSSRGSIHVHESPTTEFQFHKGLKQGDHLSSFLFILVMKSLHLSFQKVLNAGIFKGVALDTSLQLSHLFYANNVVFLGQWCDSYINIIVHMLERFFRASSLRINIHKSKLMDVVVKKSKVDLAAHNIGCMTLKIPFTYLGVKVGCLMTHINSWDKIIKKLLCRISKWKMKTLSIGGRVIKAIHGKDAKLGNSPKSGYSSISIDIVRDISLLYNKGIDLLGLIKKNVGNEENTMF
ncbi:RNA-directed DNA polymerase, eukaryota, reverse transcriptase zinc-binding domain protein [Tanacetum coccineum]